MRRIRRESADRWSTAPRGLAAAVAVLLAAALALAPSTASAAPPRPELKPFGTEVTGSSSVDDPPSLRAGSYHTTVPVLDDEAVDDQTTTSSNSRYFLISKPSGNHLRLSVGAQRPPGTEAGIGFRLSTLEDEVCAIESVDSDADDDAASPLLTASAIVSDEEDSTVPDGCVQGRALLLQVFYGEQSATTDSQQLQLGLIVEPPARNGDGLPSTADDPEQYDEPTWSPGTDRGRVKGGTSFDTAARVRSGLFRDVVSTGNIRVYRFRLDFGQQAKITTRFEPLEDTGGGRFPEDGLPVRLEVFAPGWLPVDDDTDDAQFSTSTLTEVQMPELRFRNRENSTLDNVGSTSVAGEYYVVVSADTADAADTGHQIPIRTRLQIDGKPAGVPNYAGIPSPGPGDETAGASRSDGTADTADFPAPLRAGLGAAGVLGLLVLAVVFLRRSRPRLR